MGLRAGAAKNAAPVTVTDYAPDPNGAALFHNLTARIGATLRDAPVVIERHPTFYGWAAAPQRFLGQAAALGAATVYAQRAPEMNTQTSGADSATQSVFFQRMAQGRG